MSVTIFGTDHRRPHPRVPCFFAPVDLDVEEAAYVNWANGNAAVMLDLLGLSGNGGDVRLDGEAPVPDIRRAIIRARATIDRRGPALARPEDVEHASARALPDGTIELRPLRFWSMGLDVDGMRRRLDAFERCVGVLVERGATHVAWG